MRLTLLLIVAATLLLGGCTTVFGGEKDINAVRKQYEGLSKEQVSEMGYQVDQFCIDGSVEGQPGAGAMGFHAVHPDQYMKVFESSRPQVLLLDGNGRVVGAEWETLDTSGPAPQMFGQTFEMSGPHPGHEQDHWMLHVYFLENGSELFATWNPNLACPADSLPPM